MSKSQIVSLALLLTLIILPFARADDLSGGVDQATKEIMKITDRGFEPARLSFSQLDGSVFFVNATKDSLLTVQVDFGDKRGHCASENIIFENGVMRSKVPLAPQDFALLCFPERGSYEVIARGIAGKKSISGTVVVQ